MMIDDDDDDRIVESLSCIAPWSDSFLTLENCGLVFVWGQCSNREKS